MPHSADAIANYFLGRADHEDRPLTPMHIQKLVYYAHAWYLALDDQGRPLINEPIEAWRHGPVIRSLYREFAGFGNRPVTRNAVELSSAELELVEPTIERERESSQLDEKLAKAVLDRVWEVYKAYSAVQLSNMSHGQDEPWKQISDRFMGRIPRGIHIPNELIRECFQKKLAPAH
jgi:uncharacterized phage-associated protein